MHTKRPFATWPHVAPSGRRCEVGRWDGRDRVRSAATRTARGLSRPPPHAPGRTHSWRSKTRSRMGRPRQVAHLPASLRGEQGARPVYSECLTAQKTDRYRSCSTHQPSRSLRFVPAAQNTEICIMVVPARRISLINVGSSECPDNPSIHKGVAHNGREPYQAALSWRPHPFQD